MAARLKSRKTKTNRQASIDKINAIQERLTEWRDEYDDEEIAVLTAGIQGYSDRNTMLIAMQCPTATTVRGYKAWMALGRRVRKGETGIAILAPAGSKVIEGDKPVTKEDDSARATGDEGQRIRRFFRLAYVFDIAQTDAISDEVKTSEDYELITEEDGDEF